MLEDIASIRRVVLATGDLRKGIDGLATIIGDKYKQNPFEKGTCLCKTEKKILYFLHEIRLFPVPGKCLQEGSLEPCGHPDRGNRTLKTLYFRCA